MKKILVVDDSRTMRRIITGAVRVLGYEALEAENGQDALGRLECDGADVAAITLDIAMPEMNGLECLERIKSDERFQDIPVVMVSAEAQKEILLKAVRTGARHYIIKPFTPEEISSRLLEVLDDDEF